MSDVPIVAANENPERQPGYVPELDRKLDYLIKERGGHGLNEIGRRTRSRIITQQDLAETLNVHNGNITRWRQASRIPNLVFYLPKIAEAFDCDGQSFRIDDCATFKANCELNRPSWGRLIHSAGVHVALEAVKPADGAGGFQVRAADLERFIENEKLPFVAPGQAFTVEFVAPPSKTAISAWAGWHVLMFCGDRDGFLTWLPRHKTEPEFKGADKFPVNFRELVVPREGGQKFRTARRAWGEHDIVLVVSLEPLPATMEAVLETSAKNMALSETLDQLAVWLEKRLRIDPPKAAIVRAPFFVGFAHSEPSAIG